MMRTHLDDGLGDEGVEVRHQFAVYVSHVEVLCDDSDEAHRPVTDPQVGMTQERSYGMPERTNYTVQFRDSTHSVSYYCTVSSVFSRMAMTNFS